MRAADDFVLSRNVHVFYAEVFLLKLAELSQRPVLVRISEYPSHTSEPDVILVAAHAEQYQGRIFRASDLFEFLAACAFYDQVVVGHDPQITISVRCGTENPLVFKRLLGEMVEEISVEPI